MKENKTKKTEKDVESFLQHIDHPGRKANHYEILSIMSEITQLEPKLWGKSMIGFGDYHYKYKTGREGDYFRIGFSPRKQNLTLYLMDRMVNNDTYAEELQKLGKFKTGKMCLYINKLDDIDRNMLRDIISKSYNNFNEYITKTDGWH